MSKEKLKKKVNVNTVMDWIIKILATVAVLTIAGIVVVSALPINASLMATCVGITAIAVAIEAIVLIFVVNVAIDVEFDEMKKDLDEIDRAISDLRNWAEKQKLIKKG